ncbi:MAG TPA: hypothetical protein VFJ98_06505 [Mycobacteriales bacterium]|nr:hypothetical protein [Mycobacteriales bacterium]
MTAGTVLLVPPAARAATGSGDGTVDVGFGEQGAAHTAVVAGPSDEEARAIARMRDGRLVVAARVQDQNTHVTRLGLVRYRPDGVLDTTFSHDGVLVDGLGASDVQVTDAAVLGDGRILATGWETTTSNANIFFAARYLPSGARDTTFGTNGVAAVPVEGTDDEATGMVLQPDGKVVITGSSNNLTEYAAARLTTSGRLDGTFGAGGIAIVRPSPTSFNSAEAAALGRNGDILIGGSATFGGATDTALVALTPAGRPDRTFGTNGIRTVDLGGSDGITALGVQPDGRIVAVAIVNGSKVAKRFLVHGGNDSSFAGGGVTAPLGVQTVDTIVFQPNNDILMMGDGPALAATRLSPSGTVVTSFGNNGVSSGFYPDSAPTGDAGVLQPDGTFVIAGGAFNNWTSSSDVFVMRFRGDTHAPTARITSVPAHPTSRSFGLRWTGRDDNTGIVSYDVAYRSATYRSSSYGHWRTWKSHTRVRTAVFGGLAGRTYCFRVRGHDRAGNTGAWSTTAACTATPVDDRTATVHGAWSNLTGAHYYLHTARTSSARGASLTLPVRFRRVSIVVTTCPSCGVLKVYLGKTLLKQTLLYSPHRRDRQVVLAASGSTLRSGTLRLVQGSTGKAVVVDGISVRLN